MAWVEHTIGKPRRIRDQMQATIASLEKKCPPDMTQREWNVAVHWTLQLTGNTMLPGWADFDDMRRFQCELEVRAKGKVDMDLVLWIWDEVAKIDPAGLRYKQKFRTIMLDEMQLLEPNLIASEIRKTIGSLSTRCPPEMTQEQWEIAVSWTGKLPDKSMLPSSIAGNTYDMRRFQRSLNDLRSFQRELEERVKGKVDMVLIFWIWDELAKLTPAGERYKKQFQKVMIVEIQGIPANQHSGEGDSIFGEPHDLISRIYATILSLISNRPPDLTQDQWNVAIFRTAKLPSSCLLSGWASMDDLRRFQRELEERAKEKVDMQLIFWIWDECAKLSSAAQEYKQKFQRAMLDDMQPSEGKRPIRGGDIDSEDGSEGNTSGEQGEEVSRKKEQKGPASSLRRLAVPRSEAGILMGYCACPFLALSE